MTSSQVAPTEAPAAPADIRVRPAQSRERHEIVRLFPGFQRPNRYARFWIAELSESRELIGALALESRQSSIRTLIEVRQGRQRMEVARRLLDYARQAAEKRKVVGLAAWRRVEAGSGEEAFWTDLGFERAEEFIDFEGDVRQIEAKMSANADTLRERGQIPEGAQLGPISDVTPEEVLRMRLRHLGGSPEAIRRLLEATGQPKGICPHVSRALFLDGKFVGFRLAVWASDDTIALESVVLTPEVRGGWAYALLAAEWLRLAIVRGARRYRYSVHVDNGVPQALAKRAFGREIGRRFLPFLRISSDESAPHFGIRPARLADRDMIEALLPEVRADMARHRFIVACKLTSGEVVGAGVLEQREEQARIEFGVQGHWRDLGVNRALVERLKRRARRSGSAELVAWSPVEDGSSEARRWEELGFRSDANGGPTERLVPRCPLSDFKSNSPVERDYVTIVSGLPRSGTSLMMQMLQAGGIEPLVDERRIADEDNPRGYFEYAPVKGLRQDSAWLPRAQGRALKVIHLLIASLPADSNIQYRVLLMQRDINEVIASQRAMLERRGKTGASLSKTELARVFDRQMAATKKWLEERSNFQLLTVQHRATIDQPESVASYVNAFLGCGLDTVAMANIVDRGLYRQRAE